MGDVYVGETLVAPLDLGDFESVEEIEERLVESGVVDVGDGEELYVSVADGVLRVRKLRER